MIRLISVKCPDCGAALQFEEGRQTAFCSYCGAKILLYNENEYIHRNIDEAGIKQAENDRIYMMKELEMAEKDEKHHRFLTFFWIFTALFMLALSIIFMKMGDGEIGMMLLSIDMWIGLFGLLFWEGHKKKKNRNRPGYAQIPAQAVYHENIHYSAVEAALRSAGFRNIRTINLGDLRLGLFKRNGSVESVTIGGERVSSEEWHPQEAPVIITYHGFPDI